MVLPHHAHSLIPSSTPHHTASRAARIALNRLGFPAGPAQANCPAASMRPRLANPTDAGLVVTVALVDRAVLGRVFAANRRTATLQRHIAIYLAHTVLGIAIAALADWFGRDRSTIRHALRRIEDLRDDPAFDALLDALAADLVRLWPTHPPQPAVKGH